MTAALPARPLSSADADSTLACVATGGAPYLSPDSVGVVQRQTRHFDARLDLRSGGTLDGFTLAYETYGTLNADRTNAILICHALSGDAHVAGYHTTSPDEKPGWWDDAVGRARCSIRTAFLSCVPM